MKGILNHARNVRNPLKKKIRKKFKVSIETQEENLVQSKTMYQAGMVKISKQCQILASSYVSLANKRFQD